MERIGRLFFTQIYSLEIFKELESNYKQNPYISQANNLLDKLQEPQIFYEVLAMLFASNSQNIALFSNSKSFNEYINLDSNNDIALLQYAVMVELAKRANIESSEKSNTESNLKFSDLQDIFTHLMPLFIQLNLAQILSDEDLKSLSNLTKLQPLQKPKKAESKPVSLKELSSKLVDSYEFCKKILENELKDIETIESNKFILKLDSLMKNFKNQKFSIGVTGVLSAGKSTFLNALLREEILGSSSVPETANLSVLTYGDKLSSRVHFWEKSQWEEMKQNAKYDKNLADFITQSNEIFKDKLENFITSPHLTKDIESSELSTYTSANNPAKFCNLISKVEIFTPLKFLANGVEIVDTPGLDDPITKREDITREYLKNCDMLIHVMNASCAATQVDIDFILDSLLRQKVARLLVVLTRIDLLTQSEVESCMEYTQSSLATQLRKAHYKGDIHALLSRIDFIALAGYSALLYRTNRKEEALKTGISLEKSGILEVESYLDSTLLGENSLKQKDLLQIAYMGMLSVILELNEKLKILYQMIGADKQQRAKLISQKEEENKDLGQLALSLQEKLDSQFCEFENFLQSMDNALQNSLQNAQSVLKDRIFSDIVYEYARGKRLDSSSACELSMITLKDSFADILREYQYKISAKISQLNATQNFTQDSRLDSTLISLPELPNLRFSISNSDIAACEEIISSTLPKLINTHNLNTQNDLSLKLDKMFESSFSHFKLYINLQNDKLKSAFVAYFKDIASSYQSHIKGIIDSKQEAINKALDLADSAQSEKISSILSSTLQALSTAELGIKQNLDLLHKG